MFALVMPTGLLLAVGLWSLDLRQVSALLHWWFPKVPELSSAQLAAQLASDRPPLLLDARERDEYEMSHLPGALQVPPDASPDGLVLSLGGRLKGRRVVVYCAVGGRSAALTDRSQAALIAAGATDVSHLRSGIFGWHQADMPLVDAIGSTAQVHPYNRFWGRLLKE